MTKGGILRCFGTPQHIRNKFGTGFCIEVKARAPSDLEVRALLREKLDMSRSGSQEVRGMDAQEFFSSADTDKILTESGYPKHIIKSIVNLKEQQNKSKKKSLTGDAKIDKDSSFTRS
jgi:hypothetical protein